MNHVPETTTIPSVLPLGCSFSLAAPSWVVPGTVIDNCRFLEGKVDEAALIFFDAPSSLAYTRDDLPLEMASLALSYHVHMPLILPWDLGGEAVATLCLKLLDKVDFLGVTRCVLHPPCAQAPFSGVVLLEAFAREWEKAGRRVQDVFLENFRENDLIGLLGNTITDRVGFSLCLDLGHLIAYNQEALVLELVERSFAENQVGMVHCNAPGEGGSHLALDTLDGNGMELGETLCSLLAPGGIIVAELFKWEYVARSLPIIRQWLEGCEVA